jgi:primosomal protein N' (replication factor Y) (superfamily II helicase)
MSVAQVVFDLPLEGPFDYIIPPDLAISVGMQVKVTLSSKRRIGLVTRILKESGFKDLKPIKALVPKQPVLDEFQMALGRQLSEYYGCSLGDALFTIVRGCERQKIGTPVGPGKTVTPALYVSSPREYEDILVSLIQPMSQRKGRVLILVADQFMANTIQEILKKHFTPESCLIGTRSSVFRSFKDISLVVMIDEDNPSFKQEQTPMYETREVLLMRQAIEHMEIAFLSTTPTVEMMHWVQEGRIRMATRPKAGLEPVPKAVKPQIIDLNNYKILTKGILSPAIQSILERNLANKKKSILVFNHRGSYAMTRCQDCGFVLKCQRCESPMVFSKAKKQYLCRYCSFHLPADTVCPSCRKPSWKSFGFGIEHLQKAMQEKFPLARIETFERSSEQPFKDFDILIGTWALLRFKHHIQVPLVAFLDLDSELNRLDMRSCFKAWSMVGHLRSMAQEHLMVQSRQIHHYCIQSLAQDKPEVFYEEDMKIRKELGFPPFGHHIYIYVRSSQQKQAEALAAEIYETLKKNTKSPLEIHSPLPEIISHKRGQYRLNILMQGQDVVLMMASLKETLSTIKRKGKAIVTLNVDP